MSTTLDRRLLSGLTLAVDDLIRVAGDHLSVGEPCIRCGVRFCPSWRVAAPLLRRRRAEPHAVDLPKPLLHAAGKAIPAPTPQAGPAAVDGELFPVESTWRKAGSR